MSLPVLITYSNFGYIEFAKNLILNLAKNTKHHKLHFYCLDKETYDELSAKPYPFLTVQLFVKDVSKEFESYNQEKYNKITHTKISVLEDALARYPFIHFIDCDVVCIHEPNPEIYAAYAKYDIVFQSDSKFNNGVPINLFGYWQCTGNMSMRRTAGTYLFLKKLAQYQTLRPDLNDQQCMRIMFKKPLIKISKSILHVPGMKLYVYPPEQFTNGLWDGDMSQCCFFHANYAIGKQPKIDLLKKVNEWLV
jgi:hypothetical protein